MRAPLAEEAASWSSVLRREERAEAAVPGLEPVEARAREGSSFTGGTGAATSSDGSAPNGPSGPMESSRFSRVVDAASLPCRRGVRVFDGAGRMPLLDAAAGDEGSCADVEGVCSVRDYLNTTSTSTISSQCLPDGCVFSSVVAALGAEFEPVEGTSVVHQCSCIAFTSPLNVPSHGEPSSSIVCHGFVLVSDLCAIS